MIVTSGAPLVTDWPRCALVAVAVPRFGGDHHQSSPCFALAELLLGARQGPGDFTQLVAVLQRQRVELIASSGNLACQADSLPLQLLQPRTLVQEFGLLLDHMVLGHESLRQQLLITCERLFGELDAITLSCNQ